MGSYAQDCNSRNAILQQRSISFDTFTRMIRTPGDELVTGGNSYHDDAFLSKFTASGTPLWSYRYKFIYHNNRIYYRDLQFLDLAAFPDGSLVAGGSIIEENYNTGNGAIRTLALLVKTDRYGNISWASKFQSLAGNELRFTNLLVTADGDLVAYLVSYNGSEDRSFGRVIRFGSNGAIKWITPLNTGDFDGGPQARKIRSGLLQLKNGHIVASNAVFKIRRDQVPELYKESDIHFFSLDYNTGALRWESSYQYQPAGMTYPLQVMGIKENTDRSLSFFTSLPVYLNGVDYHLKASELRTDSTGHLTGIRTIESTTTPFAKLVDMMPGPADTWYALLDMDGNSKLVQGKNDSALRWSRSFPANGFAPHCFTKREDGFGLMSAQYNTWYSQLLLTNDTGHCCQSTTDSLFMKPFNLDFLRYSVTTQTNGFDPFEVSAMDLKIADYSRTQNVVCEAVTSCCTEPVPVMTQYVDICNGTTYALPDGQVTKETGNYYALLKTAEGCDSIRFYQLKVHKDPKELELQAEDCFENKDSVVLQASSGYTNYQWMNGSSVPAPTFTVYHPGVYWVSTSNICGTATDSIEIFERCDFPIYMPDAFTPNGDGLNDVFGVPPQNHNRLVSLTIYNRWGQVIFRTNQIKEGWDGRYLSQPVSAGIYIYHLEMKGLSGRPVSQSGRLLLIR